MDRVREDVRALEHRAETRVRKTVRGVRDRVKQWRSNVATSDERKS
ncbi:hypothetical protein [Natrinema hispanicum]